MNFSSILTRLRRFLRDPDGNIWTDDDLLVMFNDSAIELCNKTGLIIRVDAGYYPPQVDFCYQHLWEKTLIEGNGQQVLTGNQASGDVITFAWEPAYWTDATPTPDEDYRLIHPWECYYASPADAVPVPLPAGFSKMKLAVYDEEPIAHITEHELSQKDGFYKTTEGNPQYYYHPDQHHNQIVPYPRPSIVYQETTIDEVMDDTGGIVSYDESWLDASDLGITIDAINLEDSFLLVYESYPEDVWETDEDIDPRIADYLVKYIEYATLERAFGVDTDGFIPTLRDYWKMRKDVGIEAIKKYKRLGFSSRDIRIGGQLKKPYRLPWPKLPSDKYVDRY